MKTRSKTKRRRIPRAELMRKWSKARSLPEAARSLGISNNAASALATRMRAKGLTLQRFDGPERIDAKALNRMARRAS